MPYPRFRTTGARATDAPRRQVEERRQDVNEGNVDTSRAGGSSQPRCRLGQRFWFYFRFLQYSNSRARLNQQIRSFSKRWVQERDPNHHAAR